MNQETQQALASFSNVLFERSSFLTELDSTIPLTLEQVSEKVSKAIFSPFEERCTRTNKRKASWIFNRQTNKFVLNRSYTTSTPLKHKF